MQPEPAPLDPLLVAIVRALRAIEQRAAEGEGSARVSGADGREQAA